MSTTIAIDKIAQIAKLLLTKETDSKNRSLDRYRKAFKTLSGIYFAQLVTVLTALITTPLLIKYLGHERYGLMVSAISFFFFFGYLDFGLGIGIQNRVSAAFGKNEFAKATKYVSSGFFFYIVLALFLMLLSLSIFPFLPMQRILKVRSDVAGAEIFPTICVLSVTVSFGLIARMPNDYVIHFNRILDSSRNGWIAHPKPCIDSAGYLP